MLSNVYNAFSFEKIAPKEKALQKENGHFRLRGGRSLLKKLRKTFLSRLVCANKVPDKSKFEIHPSKRIQVQFTKFIQIAQNIPPLICDIFAKTNC